MTLPSLLQDTNTLNKVYIMGRMYNCDPEHEDSDITIPRRQVTNFVEQNGPVSAFGEGLASHLTTDFLDTGDQNIFKLTLHFYLESQSCRGSYQSPYHFFNIRVKHVSKIFRRLNWKLCWQIVDGTHQNPGAFNTRRSNSFTQMHKSLLEPCTFAQALSHHNIGFLVI